jgi:hypothetical protein
MSPTLHPQTRIEHEGFAAEVDEEIAPLILELWRAGIETALSCQDNERGLGECRRVWIQFRNGWDAEHFLSVAADRYDDGLDSLYNRVVGGWEPEDDWQAFRQLRAWSYSVRADDRNVTRTDDGEDLPVGPPDVGLAVSVRFPFTDYGEVLARVRRYNADRDRSADQG